jgi:hypothetical protein
MQRVSDHIRDIHWPRPSIETAMRLVLNNGGVVLRWYSKTIDGVWKLRIHPVGLSTVLVVLALFFFPVEPWCRLMLPPSMADVRALAERAPLVFRGHVLTVTPIRTNTEAGARVESIAKIQIDRWYRGKGSTEALLRFAHSGEIFADGHDCIDFRPETYWTVFAVEKNGQMEMIGDGALPEVAIALQLRCVTDPSAVPDLLAILNSAPSDLTRTCVLIALGENLKDTRAVPGLAAHLSDTAVQARYDALDGLKNITHEEACTLPREWKEQDVEPQISRCKLWWEQVGKFRDWGQN